MKIISDYLIFMFFVVFTVAFNPVAQHSEALEKVSPPDYDLALPKISLIGLDISPLDMLGSISFLVIERPTLLF